MEPRINIVTIGVSDIHVSATFYKKIFDLPVEQIAAAKDLVVFFLEHELAFALVEKAEIAGIAGADASGVASPACILSYTASSPATVDEIMALAESAGGKIVKRGAPNEWGYNGYFKDPDGHLWEILCNSSAAQNYVIEVRREYNKSTKQLFSAWTDANILKQLFGLTEVEVHAQPGGSFRLATDTVTGFPGLHTESGIYQTLVPDRLLVMSWKYEGPMEPAPVETLLTLNFKQLGPQHTELILQEEGVALNSIERRNNSRFKWAMALNEIAQLL